MQAARAGGMDTGPQQGPQPGGIAGVRAYFADAAGTAAKYLARPDGPRVGAVGFVGWDTHINEGAVGGQLGQLLGALDGAIAAIETNMGGAWRETVVAIVTEFGRTARLNGNEGTDHGTGHDRAADRRRLEGRPRHRRLAGPQAAQPATRVATSSPRPTCAPSSRACSRTTCGSRMRRSPTPCSRAAPASSRWVDCSRSAAFPDAAPLARRAGILPLQWPAGSRLYARSRSGRERKYQGCGLPGTFMRSE